VSINNLAINGSADETDTQWFWLFL